MDKGSLGNEGRIVRWSHGAMEVGQSYRLVNSVEEKFFDDAANGFSRNQI